MKRIIQTILVFCLVFFIHGCNQTSGEEAFNQCLSGGCSQKEQLKVINNYIDELEKEQLRDYEIEGYDLDIRMNDEFGTGELIFIDMNYQLDAYDYNQPLSDLDMLYDKFVDAKTDFFKFELSSHLELRTRFIYTYQNLELDVVFLKIGSSGYEQLIVYLDQVNENFDEFMIEVSSYLPKIFSYRDEMEVHLSLITEKAPMILRTTPNSENLELSIRVITSYIGQDKFKEIIKSLFENALDESVNIIFM